MRQTLVQLTEELVRALDGRAERLGLSRSQVVRDLIEYGLRADAEVDRALVEAYTRDPQVDEVDEWGDLGAWTEANSRRSMAALENEDGGW